MYDPVVHELQQLPRFYRGPVEPLGDGLFKVTDSTVRGTLRAVKLISRAAVTPHVVRQVLDHFRLVGHAHIVMLKDVFLTERYFGIVMEYANRASLISLVRPGPDAIFKPPPERTILFMLQQLVIAISHFHLNDISNININPCNLLFDDLCGIPLLKVNTFTYHTHSTAIPSHERLGLNLSYLPPEALVKLSEEGVCRHSQTHLQPTDWQSTPSTSGESLDSFRHSITDCMHSIDGKARDAWSCGLVLYTMMYGSLPYNIWTSHHSVPDVLGRMRRRQYRLHESPRYSEGCKRLLWQLLDPDQTTRISIKGILDDPWFKRGLNETHLTYNASVQQAQRRHYRRYHIMHTLREAATGGGAATEEICKILEREQQSFAATRNAGAPQNLGGAEGMEA